MENSKNTSRRFLALALALLLQFSAIPATPVLAEAKSHYTSWVVGDYPWVAINVTASPSEGGIVSGGGDPCVFRLGSDIPEYDIQWQSRSITARANPGWTFEGWYIYIGEGQSYPLTTTRNSMETETVYVGLFGYTSVRIRADDRDEGRVVSDRSNYTQTIVARFTRTDKPIERPVDIPTENVASWNPTAEAQTADLTLTTDVSWAVASSDTSWLSVAPVSGYGNGNLIMSVTANTNANKRNGTITITGGNRIQTVTVTQEGAQAASLTVDTSGYNPSSAAQSINRNVTSNVPWTAASSQTSWLSVSPASDSGNGSITVSVTENTETKPRSGNITIKGGGVTRTFSVMQAAAQAESVLTVSKTSWNPEAAAQSDDIEIESNVLWTAASSQTSWLSVSPASDSGNGSITISVTENTGTKARSGNITIKGGGITRTIKVTQAAAAKSTIKVSKTAWNPSSVAESVDIEISSNGAWTAASSQPSWLSVSPASDSGNGSITISVTENTGTEARTGTITITGGLTAQKVTFTYAMAAMAALPYNGLGGVRTPVSEKAIKDTTVNSKIFAAVTGASTQTITITQRAAASAPITSIPNNHSSWATVELVKAANMGIIPDTLKDPSIDYTKPITRLEFAGVVVRTFEIFTDTTAIPELNNPFTDTEELDALKGYNTGIMVGMSTTKFEPNTLLNREQTAAVLCRILKRMAFEEWTIETDANHPLNYNGPLFADDKNISAWAREGVYYMAEQGIIAGMGNNTFAPRAITPEQKAAGYAMTTREQALTLALRMIEKNLR